MTRRRNLRAAIAMAVAVTTGFLAPMPAKAQVVGLTHEEPNTRWSYPGPGQFLDAVGTFLYVVPQPPPAPNGHTRDGYEYKMTFVFAGLKVGYVSLATTVNGPVARLKLIDLVSDAAPSVAEVAYDWSPGRFYFLYTQRLATGAYGAWVMDWETSVWTYIGSLTPPGWGGIVDVGLTSVAWSGERPVSTCSFFPRTDAYFYPVLGYTGSTFEVGVADLQFVHAGDCPSQTEMLGNGWVHYRLGNPA